MKLNLLTRTLALAGLTTLVLFSCKKEHSDTMSADQEEQAINFSTQSETESQLVFNDVFDNVMGVNAEVGIGNTGVFGRVASGISGRDMNVDSLPPCLTVTVTRLNLPEPFPVRIVMDFGQAGCLCADGHRRFGKIITTYTGRLINPGKSATTTFDGFRIDSFAVQGTHTVTNTTTAGSAQMQLTVDVADGKITRPNGDYSLWTGHRVITRVEGNATATPLDDIFSITGNAHGRVKRGNLVYAWQSEITEPLRKRFDCHWISKGTIRLRRETLPATSPWVATLDYGTGTCDFLATLTIQGVVHQIQLPH